MGKYRQDNAASVRGLALRVSRLAADGNPVVEGAEGCDSYLSTEFVQFTFTPSYQEADEISVTNAAGEVCVYYKPPDTLKAVEFSLELCNPDPILTQMLVGGAVLLADASSDIAPADTGEDDIVAAGYAAPKIGAVDNPYGVAVEVWTAAIVGGKNAAKGAYWHYVFPYAIFKMDGDRVLENGAVATVFAGQGSGNAAFGAGPNMDMTGVIPAVTSDTFAWPFPQFTDRPFAYARVANAPIGLKGCFVNLGEVTSPAATGAIAGAPGQWIPSDAHAPANIAAMTSIDAVPDEEWAEGQYIVLGDGSAAHWSGTAWAAGAAPGA